MKKYIFSLLLIIGTCQAFAQPRFYTDDEILFNKTLNVLKDVINKSQYIVEGISIGGDYYYIPEEDQTYFRTFIKVNKVLRGISISQGDTIVGVFPQYAKGQGIQLLPSHSEGPRLWYRYGYSESCLFFTDNKFTCEPRADEWSHFKKITYIDSELGYLGAFYDGTVKGKSIAVSVEGILFNNKKDWYNYLKQYPDIKVPEGY